MRTNMLLLAVGLLVISASLAYVYLPLGTGFAGGSLVALGMLRDDGKRTK